MSDVISSATNPRVKAVARLRDRRERDRTGSILIEGGREIARAIESGRVDPAELFTPADSTSDLRGLAVAVEAAGGRITLVEGEALRRLSVRGDSPVLVGSARSIALDEVDPPAGSMLFVVESLEKPGNLGAILRTCDGAGVGAVIVADPATDLYNPNVIRASMGAVFTVPVSVTDTASAISWLRRRGTAIAITSPDASLPWHRADLTQDVALVVGPEQLGLSRSWLEAADLALVLPMVGEVDSLNAATTAAIVLYEAVRQRSLSPD